jgi:hypothetical protein
MIHFVLAALLFWQGPIGKITGSVRGPQNRPQAGVRVAAMAAAEATDTLVSITKTDEAGRYVLEVPAGSYYILAGRVDNPSYYPASATRTGATAISATGGTTTSGVDFVQLALVGVVRGSDGKPQVDVPVAAIDAGALQRSRCVDARQTTSQTDEAGRYRLDVFPGRYYVVALMQERTTYYPAAPTVENATAISLTAAEETTSIDLTVPPETRVTSTARRDIDLFGRGVESVKLGCHVPARLFFQMITTTYPESEFAAKAKFAMADSLYREGTSASLQEAARTFMEFIRFFPTAAEVPEARQRLADIEKKAPSATK